MRLIALIMIISHIWFRTIKLTCSPIQWPEPSGIAHHKWGHYLPGLPWIPPRHLLKSAWTWSPFPTCTSSCFALSLSSQGSQQYPAPTMLELTQPMADTIWCHLWPLPWLSIWLWPSFSETTCPWAGGRADA